LLVKHKAFLFAILVGAFSACTPAPKSPSPKVGEGLLGAQASLRTVYKSAQLTVTPVSPHAYQHISYMQTQDFGKVSCNGMVVLNGGEAVVFDSPADTQSAQELLRFVTDSLHSRITAVVPTHFHADCVGGLEAFFAAGIPVHVSNKTIALLKKKGKSFSGPLLPFTDSLVLPLGNQKVEARYFGAGHTTDNIVGYYGPEEVLFGGCLIKAVGAKKGNLEDADTVAWSQTVSSLKAAYPRVKVVIPGHEQTGGAELLDYTVELFRIKAE
jgi:metallo-beta-lactamase class B